MSENSLHFFCNITYSSSPSSVFPVTPSQQGLKYYRENSREKKQFISFNLHSVLSSMIKFCSSLLQPIRNNYHTFVLSHTSGRGACWSSDIRAEIWKRDLNCAEIQTRTLQGQLKSLSIGFEVESDW